MQTTSVFAFLKKPNGYAVPFNFWKGLCHLPPGFFVTETIIQQLNLTYAMPPKVYCSPLDYKRARHAIDYLQRHYTETISPIQLAEECSLPERKLQQLFKELTGETVHNFQLALRIEQSKEALANFDKQVKEIADAMGFRSPSHFNRHFKKQVGMTPKEYRMILLLESGYLDPVTISKT